MLSNGPFLGAVTFANFGFSHSCEKLHGNSFYSPLRGTDWRCTLQLKNPPQQSSARPSIGFRNDSELDMLLNLAATTVRPSLPPQPEVAVEDVNPEVQVTSLNDLFTSHLNFEHELQELCGAQHTMQKLLFGDDWRPIVDSFATQSIQSVTRQAISQLIGLAEKRFAITGGTLTIDHHDTLNAAGLGHWEDQYERRNRRVNETTPTVDLDKLWAYLTAKYAGEAGVEESHRQNARFLIKKLQLDGEVKRTASSVSCSLRVYSRIIEYGSNAGRYNLGYSNSGEERKVFTSLACVFEWAGLDQLAIELAPCRHTIGDYNFDFKPREKVSFTGMEVIFFKDKWELKFAHATAEKLMQYLGMFGEN